MLETPFYIACLRLKGRRCLVVGGGSVGLEKVEGLLACDARVHVIAPAACPEIRELASQGTVEWSARAFAPGDRVKIELSPYDLTRGRITYRFK